MITIEDELEAPIDDITATEYFDELDSADEQRRRVITSKLHRYADAKDAQNELDEANHHKKLITDEAYRRIVADRWDVSEALQASGNPAVTEKRAVMMSYVSHRLGRPVSTLEYEMRRDGFARAYMGKRSATDEEFLNFVKVEFEKSDEIETSLADAAKTAVANAVNSHMGDKEPQVLTGYMNWAGSNQDIVQKFKSHKFETHAFKAYNKAASSVTPYAKDAAVLFDGLQRVSKGEWDSQDLLNLAQWYSKKSSRSELEEWIKQRTAGDLKKYDDRVDMVETSEKQSDSKHPTELETWEPDKLYKVLIVTNRKVAELLRDHKDYIEEYAALNKVDPDLVRAIIIHESRGFGYTFQKLEAKASELNAGEEGSYGFAQLGKEARKEAGLSIDEAQTIEGSIRGAAKWLAVSTNDLLKLGISQPTAAQIASQYNSRVQRGDVGSYGKQAYWTYKAIKSGNLGGFHIPSGAPAPAPHPTPSPTPSRNK